MDRVLGPKYSISIRLKNPEDIGVMEAILSRHGSLPDTNSHPDLMSFHLNQPFQRDYVLCHSANPSSLTVQVDLFPLGESSIYIVRKVIEGFLIPATKTQKISVRKIVISQVDIFGQKNLFPLLSKPWTYYLRNHLLPLIGAFALFGIISLVLKQFWNMDLGFKEALLGALMGTAMTVYYAVRGDFL